MEHSSHEHALILNEKYIARDGDVCRGCSEKILSCKSFVYSCSNFTGAEDNLSCAVFLLHKSCAELPTQIPKPTQPNEFLQLCFKYSNRDSFWAKISSFYIKHCDICGIRIPFKPEQFFYSSNDFHVCLKCVFFQTQQSLEDPKLKHPAHTQHPLSLTQHPSSFKCYACDVDDNIKDMSYRCTKCQFWIHKSCADAPTPFQFQFHDKHPLILSFSLPKAYHKYKQHCRLCNETLSRLVWLYCCFNCRFFVHFQCARSNQMLSSCENEKYDSNVVQLPAADELSVKLMCEKFITATSIQNNGNIHSNFISENGIKHWSHEEHHLQLIDSNELKNEQDDDEILLLCDGCVQPIGTHQFYRCVTCKYFLHKFCAELPKRIKTELDDLDDDDSARYANASKHSEPYKLFYCDGCGDWCNGIFFNIWVFKFHMGCVTLPKMIKHEAHPHKLKHVFQDSILIRRIIYCKACGRQRWAGYKCEQCDYDICGSCIMKPRVANHPWDRHPLRLIYEPGMVIEHEHDFNCEFCSEDIDTNYWFYHCSDCDLSLHHHECFEKSSYRQYSNVKFGATDIIIDKLHPHSLTFGLNKKFRSCQGCHRNQLGNPVLECAGQCKSILCVMCISKCLGFKMSFIN